MDSQLFQYHLSNNPSFPSWSAYPVCQRQIPTLPRACAWGLCSPGPPVLGPDHMVFISLTECLGSGCRSSLIWPSVGLSCYSWPFALQHQPSNMLHVPQKNMVGIFIRNTLIYKLQWNAVDIFSGLKVLSINPVHLPVY